MNTLRLWEPFGMLREFDDVFRNFGAFGSATRDGKDLLAKTDIAETDKSYEIALEVSGIEAKDLTLEVKDDVLSIKGERKFEEKAEDGKKYITVERRYGKFSRSFGLPEKTDKKGIKADCKNGILTVTVPKTEVEEKKPLKIEVS
ncbi:MAG: Hsp20 family protein [Candidatus Mycalebacterium zealandia]|nr:MAG: Hsp20 family protein [Candidatus Mycalebacterium zealandia]